MATIFRTPLIVRIGTQRPKVAEFNPPYFVTSTVASTVPFFQTNWPRPAPRLPKAPSFDPPYPGPQSQVGATFKNFDFPRPAKRPPKVPDFDPPNLATQNPFALYEWPLPKRGRAAAAFDPPYPGPQSSIGPTFVQTDWPPPKRGKPKVPSFDPPYVVTTIIGGTPFRQVDWPNPKRGSRTVRDFVPPPFVFATPTPPAGSDIPHVMPINFLGQMMGRR